MLTQFWTGLGSQFAQRWLAIVFSPAFAFWAGGLAAWVWGEGERDARAQGWSAVIENWSRELRGLPVVVQGALVIAVLLGITASAGIAQLLTLPVIRALEGYWPRWLHPIRAILVNRQARKLDGTLTRLRALAGKAPGHPKRLTAKEQQEYVRLDARRRRTPARDRLLPTRLGNILRAAESRPAVAHGLDAITCWPRLWLLLPDSARVEVGNARASLNAAAQVWLWGVLFIVWTVWTWWALPVGLLVAWMAYRRMLVAAATYGDLVEASFDLYRRLLYEALRWPLPATLAEERRTGRALTQYLWRGDSAAAPVLVVPNNQTQAQPAAQRDGAGLRVLAALRAALRFLSAPSPGNGTKPTQPRQGSR